MFCEGNGFIGTQEPFGCINFPLNPVGKWFYEDFPQTQKSLGPLGPLAELPIALCVAYDPVWQCLLPKLIFKPASLYGITISR